MAKKKKLDVMVDLDVVEHLSLVGKLTGTPTPNVASVLLVNEVVKPRHPWKNKFDRAVKRKKGAEK